MTVKADKPEALNLVVLVVRPYVLKAEYWPSCFARLFCCFGFHGRKLSIVYECYSGGKEKPQNFQHHNSGCQEIAVCNA